MYPTLSKIGALNKSNIKIKNLEKTEKLVSTLLSGSSNSLQFIVDFDYTLSRGHFDGEQNSSSWGVLDDSEHVPSFYREESEKLFQKYYPIETHSTMPVSEKIPHMKEWYRQVKDLLIKCKLDKDKICPIVKNSKIGLRDNTDTLMKSLKEKNIPLLVFSAGMGDILVEILRLYSLYFDNVKVISNFFKFDDKGVIVDFYGEQIHMFNKNQKVLTSSDTEYFNLLKDRTNVVLMGDSTGDATMAVGVPEPNNVVKIGFLNEKFDRLDKYMDIYDIVLIKDQTMDLANAIVANLES